MNLRRYFKIAADVHIEQSVSGVGFGRREGCQEPFSGTREKGYQEEKGYQVPFMTARQTNTVCRFLCGSSPRAHANRWPDTNRVTSDK